VAGCSRRSWTIFTKIPASECQSHASHGSKLLSTRTTEIASHNEPMIKARQVPYAISRHVWRTALLLVLLIGVVNVAPVNASIGVPKIDQENEVYVTVDSWKRIPLPSGEWKVVGSAEAGGFFSRMIVVTMINLNQESDFRLVILRYNISRQTLNRDECKEKNQGTAVGHWQQSFEKPLRIDTCSYFQPLPEFKSQLTTSWKDSARWGPAVATIPENYASELPDDAVLFDAEVTSPSDGFVQVAAIIRNNPARSSVNETTEQLSKGWAGAEPAEQRLIHWRQEFVRMMRLAFFGRAMPKSDDLAFNWESAPEEPGKVLATKPWFDQPSALAVPAEASSQPKEPDEATGRQYASQANTSPATPTKSDIDNERPKQRQSDPLKVAASSDSPSNSKELSRADTGAREATQELKRLAEGAVGESRERPSTSVATGTKKAIVIGNDTYTTIPKLKNARADAKALGQTLGRLGYTVTTHIDQDEKGMKRALRDFMRTVSGGDEVVFFYAGHGVQIAGVNYLLPVDMRADDERTVRDEAISLQRILDDMSEAKARLTVAIIDACRDNPFSGSGRSIGGRGLSPTTAATGQVILFSAGSGQQALDSVGPNDPSKNGLFTRTLLKHINRPGETIDRVMRTVRNEVALTAKSVGHEQVPALYDQVIGDFYFAK